MAESSPNPSPEPVPEDLTGRTIGRFVIRARLGSGAMGEVYRADDTRLKRPVALKRIAAQLRADPVFRERLAHEAELASRLNDPHIAGVYDIFEEGRETFLVMEFVEGETLRERLRRRLSLTEFFEIATQCAAALASAHGRGILHCDIKPANIVLTPQGRVKILDFGLAKRLPGSGDSATLASEGRIFRGTPAYMAPEVLLEKGQDARSDIFSLGVVFYEMLAGKNPFLGDSFVATCQHITHVAPPALRAANPVVPPELEAIVKKMLAKEAGERYASAAELLAALRATSEKLPAIPCLSLPPRPRSRRRLLLASVALAGIAAAAIAAGLYRHSRTPPITKNDWILMTDFTNRSGQPLFQDTVSEAFRSALEQSRSVRLVPRTQVVEAGRLMGRPQLANIDQELGREICQRGNCRAVLAGEITSVGPGYQISVELDDPWRDVPVFTEQASLPSPAELYPTVDRLARRLRQRLGESLADIQKSSTPLAKVTTPSLEALQRYTRAKRLYDAGDLQDALPLAKSAIDLDPDFPMDHLLLMRIYDRLGSYKQGEDNLARAMRGLDRVTERERYLIEAMGYADRNLNERAAEQYRLLTQLHPDELLAYQGLAESLRDLGRLEEAVVAEQQALKLSPDSSIDYNYLITTLDRLNRFPQALGVFAAAQSRGIQSPLLHWGAGLAYLGQGNTEAAGHEFELLKQGGDYGENIASFFQASLLAYEGRLGDAIQELRTGVVLGEKLESEASVLSRRRLLAVLLAISGRHAEALVEARELARNARRQADPWGLESAGLVGVRLGDLPLARQLLGQLDKLRSQNQGSGFLQSCYSTLAGSIELAQGDARAAIASERAALVYYPPAYEAGGVLAEAYARQHNWPEAIRADRRYLGFHGEMLFGAAAADWVVGHLRLARALAEARQTDEALRSYNSFLSFWANADPGLPSLVQARAEQQRLSAFPQAAGNAVRAK